MEDLLVIIFQIIGQIIFELLAYMPFDFWWPFRSLDPRDDDSFSIIWWWFLVAAGGAAIGGISLYFFPDVMVKFGWLRIALLFMTPLGSAFLAKSLAEMSAKKDRPSDPMSHFWFALCFSAGLVFVRFTFAHRPV